MSKTFVILFIFNKGIFLIFPRKVSFGSLSILSFSLKHFMEPSGKKNLLFSMMYTKEKYKRDLLKDCTKKVNSMSKIIFPRKNSFFYLEKEMFQQEYLR
jgi:hypothetical protein